MTARNLFNETAERQLTPVTCGLSLLLFSAQTEKAPNRSIEFDCPSNAKNKRFLSTVSRPSTLVEMIPLQKMLEQRSHYPLTRYMCGLFLARLLKMVYSVLVKPSPRASQT